jgi:hypothetical protein
MDEINKESWDGMQTTCPGWCWLVAGNHHQLPAKKEILTQSISQTTFVFEGNQAK